MGSVGIITDSNKTNDNDEALVSDLVNVSGQSSTLNITTTPQEATGSSPLAGRKYVIFRAIGRDIVWGFSNSNQAFPMDRGETVFLPIGENIEIWFATTSGTAELAFAEIA